MAAAADSTYLDRDDNGNPRSLRLFARLVEAESRRYAARAASLSSDNDLVRGFRGGATPIVAIGEFLERVQSYLHCEGSIFVLATVYLTRFIRSRAARDVGILVEPATAHRLVSVALLLGAKFASPEYAPNSPKVFPLCSHELITASELSGLEVSFLRAIDYRLFVSDAEFQQFCGHLECGPRAGESCSGRKRKAAVAGGVEEPRSVRSCRPPVVAS